jgi:hypothetical protein
MFARDTRTSMTGERRDSSHAGQFEQPSGPTGPPTLFSIPVLRYMKTYGLTHEQLRWSRSCSANGGEEPARHLQDADHRRGCLILRIIAYPFVTRTQYPCIRIPPTEPFGRRSAMAGLGHFRSSEPHCGMSAIHTLRTSAIVMHTRMDGIASSGTERDRRELSVASPSSAAYLHWRVVEACPFCEIGPEICGDESRDCLPGPAC